VLTFACVPAAKDTTRRSTTPVARNAFSDAQLAQLAREALKHTPENVHFEPGAVFKWVRFPSPELEFAFPSSEVDHFPEFTNRVREELSKKYIVYAKQEDIPRELVTGDASRPEFVDGFLFSVTLRRLSPIRIEVKYHDYERYLGHGDALPRSTGRN
jgi:hypothetical protein